MARILHCLPRLQAQTRLQTGKMVRGLYVSTSLSADAIITIMVDSGSATVHGMRNEHELIVTSDHSPQLPLFHSESVCRQSRLSSHRC